MMYAGLAGVYDRLTDDFDYDAWAQTYARFVRDICPGARTLIDCGCGTGSLAVRFARMGFDVLGVDLSNDMLIAASDKARAAGVRVKFACQDMRALSVPKPMDALVCACDGVNYLTDDRSVDKFFARAFAALKPGGAFAFDVSNLGKLRKMGADRFYGEEREALTYLWLNDWDEGARKLIMRLSFFMRRPDGLYNKFSETHVQRAHTVCALARALWHAGFRDICVHGGDKGETDLPGGARAYLRAKKP